MSRYQVLWASVSQDTTYEQLVLIAPNNRVETAQSFAPQLLETLSDLKIGQLVKLSYTQENGDF